METEGISLAELRARYSPEGAPIDEALLEGLRGDRRAGAHALARQLERRLGRERRESGRLRELYSAESELVAAGLAPVAGVDEVGMGPLAGPVVAAAVVLAGEPLRGLRDSKQLARPARERLEREIRARAADVSVAEVSPAEIDRINIYQAGLLAMRRAVEGLGRPARQLLVDARRIPGLTMPQRPVVRGDATIASIAAASIVAKVWRDRRMRELDARHPAYGFARNAGYGTPEHLAALETHGPSPVHRRSFAPVARAGPEAPCPTS